MIGERSLQVNIRLTTDEYEKVSGYAVASGLRAANWIRREIFALKVSSDEEIANRNSDVPITEGDRGQYKPGNAYA